MLKRVMCIVLTCCMFCSCSKLNTDLKSVISKNSNTKSNKIYTELGKIYNGTNILQLFNKYDDLGWITVHWGLLDDRTVFTRDTVTDNTEMLIKKYSEYFDSEEEYEVYNISDDAVITNSNGAYPYDINFKRVTGCINELLVSDNGELKVSTNNSNTYPVDKNTIDYINKYLKKQYLSYGEAYEFSNYLFDIKANTKWKYKDRYIEPSFTVSMMKIDSHNKMTKEQFNKLMLKDSSSHYNSIKVFNNKKYNGAITFLPSQVMPK